MSKKNYVVYYRNLKYQLSEGLIVKKFHRILEFKQSAWMKPYIDFNTQKRKEATNAADKNQVKLLNNAVYGKTMENMRKRIKIRITTNEKDLNLDLHTSRPMHLDLYTLDIKDLVKIQLQFMNEKKELLTLNKPIYVGNTVLELSKLAM